MNIKESNLHKIIAASVLGLILIFLIVIATGGKTHKDDNNSGEFDETINNTDESNGDTDSNAEGTADNITDGSDDLTEENGDQGDIPKIPEFINAITGLECDEELSRTMPFAFVLDPDAPLYGISYSDITVEIPTENGKTRLLLYITDDSELGKIGAILPTRDYITQITDMIPGIAVFYGDDGLVNSSLIEADINLNLKENYLYTYMENGSSVYTDSKSINEFAKRYGVNRINNSKVNLPFEFCDFNDFIIGKNKAENIQIPYSSSKNSILSYNTDERKYVFSKADKSKVDLLTGQPASFTNVFVLFSNFITYETASGTQTVTETASGGYGYYATGGGLVEIRWRLDENQTLIFETLIGEKLKVNRGNSYIGYYKSADKSSVVFE